MAPIRLWYCPRSSVFRHQDGRVPRLLRDAARAWHWPGRWRICRCNHLCNSLQNRRRDGLASRWPAVAFSHLVALRNLEEKPPS